MMSTVIRPEVSKRNKYWIDKHRYYELKHFCLQYHIWKQEYEGLNNSLKTASSKDTVKTNSDNRPLESLVEKRLYYAKRIEMIDRIAHSVDPVIGIYIFKAVTEGLSYAQLRMVYDIPCCKDVYYELYREFFWLLSEERQ